MLDTHALIWWLTDDARLGRRADIALRSTDNEVLVSAVSAYEIAQKYRLGKLPEVEALATGFATEIAQEGFVGLAVTIADAQFAGQMENAHRDPFDRLLIAQSLLNGLTVVSNERVFDTFGVSRLW